ncbi:MAG: glycosyltransferase [Anaerohalosphaeraceae bacterium]|nr:glycosyltransferase [Anaerohalosphaeraceae bacterium]
MKEMVFLRQSSVSMGGVEWQIVKLAEILSSRGYFKPVLITSDDQSVFGKTFAACGFEVFSVPMSNKKTFSAAVKILRILKNRDVAAVHTHLLQESLIGRIIRKKRPNIRHIFRVEVYPSDANPIWKKKFFYLVDKLTNRWVDCYIANGRYLSDEIINCSGVNPKKVVTLLNGRDPIGLPDEPVKIFDKPLPAKIAMVANFIPGKGYDCLVKALAVLKKKNIEIEARLIGSEGGTGSEGNEGRSHTSIIKELAESLGVSKQIEFYGYTKDVYKAIEEIPVIVLPSRSALHHREGIPNCILEAMSLRKLVIASNVGGVSEMIEDGKSGFLHNPEDFAGLADNLERVFSSPAADWEDMRNAAFQNWQQNFTFDIMIDKIIDIYKELGLVNHD